MRSYVGSSTPRGKKWRQLAGAGSRHNARKRGKGTGQNPGQVTLSREKVNNRGEEFPKPEHGGLCQLGLEIAVKKGGQPRNATTRDGVHLGSNHLGATAIRSMAALLPCSEFPRPRSCRASWG